MESELENGRHRLPNMSWIYYMHTLWARNWTQCSRSLSVQQRWRLLLALGSRMRKMRVVGISIPTKELFGGKIIFLATEKYRVRIEIVSSNTDAIEACTKQQSNTKWKIGNLTNVTVNVCCSTRRSSHGIKDAVLLEPLKVNHIIICLAWEENKTKPYKDNLWLFVVLALHLHGNGWNEEDTSKKFNLFLERSAGTDRATFKVVFLNINLIVEELLQVNVSLYDKDFLDTTLSGELVKTSFGKQSNTVWLLRYKSHLCFAYDINVLFNAHCCPSCDNFFSITPHLEYHLSNCIENFEHMYPKNLYLLLETLFDKLDLFGIPYTDKRNFFEIIEIFDFDTICLGNEEFKDT